MDKQTMTFNLLSEPWIQVEMLDGSVRKVGLEELFFEAHTIRGLAGELPQMQFVTLRLCEAILYRALGAPDASEEELLGLWQDLWERGAFPHDDLSFYFSACREGFDLFGSRPFYQVAGLSYASGEVSPIGVLMPDVPAKADKTLFAMRSVKHAGTLSFDEAARYLLVAQGYDISGIKTPVVGNTHINEGKVFSPKGLLGTGYCGGMGGTFIEGSNFFETLMLNWVLFDDHGESQGLFGVEGDLPPWERTDIGADMAQYDPVGPVQTLTWQSRRIRLVPSEDGSCVKGVVLCYGDAMRPIDNQGIEMMTPWRKSEAQQKKWSLPYVPRMARKHDPNKSIWRGLSSLLAYENTEPSDQSDLRPGVVRWIERLEDKGILEKGTALTIHAQGMGYGKRDGFFADGIDDAISLHAIMLRHDSEATVKTLEVITQTDAAVGALVRFIQNVSIARGDKRRYSSLRDSAANVARQDVATRAFDELDGLFRDRIARFAPCIDPYAYSISWMQEVHKILWRIAEDYLSESDISFFSGGAIPPGRALELLRLRLNKLLGPLTTDQKRADSNSSESDQE